MRVEAIVPVRGLPAGKRRLAALLSPDQRKQLIRAMLSDVINALRASDACQRVTVVSRDVAAAREAARLGAAFLQQPAVSAGLNTALRYAQSARAGTEALLIVPADTPCVTSTDIDALVAAGADPPSVVLAPSHFGGTNGLLLAPPVVIAPAFGPDSAVRHTEAARAAGAAVRTVANERWALDIDHPEDLRRLLALADADPEVEALATVACLRTLALPTQRAADVS